MKAPVLLLAGSDDAGCVTQMREAFVALRRVGVPVELRVYAGEGHSPASWAADNLRDACERVLDWLTQHLGTATEQAACGR